MKPSPNKRPLVLLDVDGVINDLAALSGGVDPRTHAILASNGFRVAIPHYMPVVIQWLCEVADVHWCTTWRHRANDEIATHLGIPALPVVDDGTDDRHVHWKAAAAHDLAATALAEGRRVVWIEDFYDDVPVNQMPAGVEFVDTASDENFEMVLTVDMIPDWLWTLATARRVSPRTGDVSPSGSPKAA